jgi:hypothetical protein
MSRSSIEPVEGLSVSRDLRGMPPAVEWSLKRALAVLGLVPDGFPLASTVFDYFCGETSN